MGNRVWESRSLPAVIFETRCRKDIGPFCFSAGSGFQLAVGLLLLGGAMNHDLMRAIADKRLVEFVYKTGRARLVEPHDYGIRKGAECLLGYQISGESRSGTPHGWKQFELERMGEVRVLERRFAGTRAGAAQHHRAWDTLFARVT
jgi:hypothetical protein